MGMEHRDSRFIFSHRSPAPDTGGGGATLTPCSPARPAVGTLAWGFLWVLGRGACHSHGQNGLSAAPLGHWAAVTVTLPFVRHLLVPGAVGALQHLGVWGVWADLRKPGL